MLFESCGLSAGFLPIDVNVTYTAYELTVTTLKSWQSPIRSVSRGSLPPVRLATQPSTEVVVGSVSEVGATSAVVVASELAMETVVMGTKSVDSVPAAVDVSSVKDVS